MSKIIATTKWCPCCNCSQKIKGFRSYRCRDCWVAAGRPKVEVHFKAMDKPKPVKVVVKETSKRVLKSVVYKPVVLIEDRPKKRVKRKVPKKPLKKVVKKKK